MFTSLIPLARNIYSNIGLPFNLIVYFIFLFLSFFTFLVSGSLPSPQLRTWYLDQLRIFANTDSHIVSNRCFIKWIDCKWIKQRLWLFSDCKMTSEFWSFTLICFLKVVLWHTVCPIVGKHLFLRYRKNRIDLSADIDILGQHKIVDTGF